MCHSNHFGGNGIRQKATPVRKLVPVGTDAVQYGAAAVMDHGIPQKFLAKYEKV
jgi:hypothetical protein